MKDFFIDKGNKVAYLVDELEKLNNFILVAPRRYGKTMVALKVLEEIRKNSDYLVIEINLLFYSGGCVSSVAEGITEKLLNILGLHGKIRQMWNDPDFNARVELEFRDLEIEPLLNLFKDGDELVLLENALNLVEKIAIRENRTVVMFYDEFGELATLGERVLKVFSSVIQKHTHVSYLFAGSPEMVMNRIFVNKTGALYKFGKIINLKELAKKEIYNYIIDMYPLVNMTIGGIKDIRIIDSVVTDLCGHPYYTAQAIKFLELNKDNCTIDSYLEFLHEELLVREKDYLIQQLLAIKDKLYALDILRMIALKLNPYTELTNIRTQNIYRILTWLEDGGYIRNKKYGEYSILDPLLTLLIIRN